VIALLAFAAAAISANDLDGDWVTADRHAIVRIAPCGADLCGTVVRVLVHGPNVPTTDIKNPDRRLRSRPLIGLKVLTGFSRDGPIWTGGRAYDPNTGGNYKARLSRNPDGSLTVTGCILFICKSQRWTRVGR
jgi:uncharacterized protein (DUF2147 family)